MAGQLVRRGDRKFVVRVYTGRDGEGKRNYINRTVNGTKKDAERVLTEMLSQRDLGGLAKAVRQTLDAHIAKWLENAVKPRVRQRTHDDYSRLVQRYIKPGLGSRLLTQIGADDVQKFYRDLSKKGLSARTIRYTHAVLNNALKFAVRWKQIPFNPCDHVDLPKVKRREMSALSPEQAKLFLEMAKSDPYYALWTLLLTTGMRPSEALALRWSDIDLEGGILRIERALAGRTGSRTFEEPKTNRSRRQIPIPALTVAPIRAHKALNFGSGAQDAFGLVFRTRGGQPLDLQNISKRNFKPILERAGLPETIRVYDLRHSCATLLLAAGENPKIVAERLGHANIVLTLDTYSHVLPDMQRGASERLEKLLG